LAGAAGGATLAGAGGGGASGALCPAELGAGPEDGGAANGGGIDSEPATAPYPRWRAYCFMASFTR